MSGIQELKARNDTLRSPAPENEINLGHLVGALWMGRFGIAALALLALAFGAFHIANTMPTYQADALLQLEERSGQMALPSEMRDLLDDNPRTITEIEIISSRMVLGQVVADLNLDWGIAPKTAPLFGTLLSRYDLPFPDQGFMAPYARPGETLTLEFLEVPPRWLGSSLMLEVEETGYRVTDPDGHERMGVFGETLRDAEQGFALRVEALGVPFGRVFEIRQHSELAAIGRLRSGLSVSERGRQSGILEARFQGPDQAEATRILNAIIQAYVRQNIARSAAEAESSLNFIETQLPEAEAAVRRAERALNEFRQEQTSIDLPFETQNLLTQVTRVETELRGLQVRDDELSQRYTPSHPTYQQFMAERDRLQERLDILRGEVSALPETQREVLNLTRSMEVAQSIYTQLLTRAQEMQVLRARTVGNVRVVDAAASSGVQVAPQKNLILALALVLGGMSGCALVLVRKWMRRGVQSAEELEKAGLSVFATITYSAHVGLQQKRKGNLPILAIEEPTDLAVEGLRSLRTSLHFGMIDARTRSLAITSAAPEAGKTFTSLNLAVVAAQAGQRVCLIDADLRRGELQRFFNLPRRGNGLAEILAGATTLDEALLREVQPNLAFLPSGRYPPNPSELLMRRDFSALVERLNDEFDLAIFDCPPALAVTDPVIVGRSVGSTVIVARHDVTPMGEVEAVRKTLNTTGVHLAGAILNGFDPRKARGGYGNVYSYRYAYRARNE